MANIATYLNNIKNALYGKDVRGSIHDGIDAINKEVEGTTAKQVDLESTFDQLVINAGNSNAEIVDARVESNGTSYKKLGDRLNKFDEQFNTKANEVDLQETKNRIDNLIIHSTQSEGNAELIDGRMGVEGSSHGTIGNHIRNIENGYVKNIDQECFNNSIYNNINKRYKYVDGVSATYSEQIHCTIAKTLLNSTYNFGTINNVKCNLEFESLSGNIKSVETRVQVKTVKTGKISNNTVCSLSDSFNFESETGDISIYTWVNCNESGVKTSYILKKLEVIVNDNITINLLNEKHSFVFNASGTTTYKDIFSPAITNDDKLCEIMNNISDLMTLEGDYSINDSRQFNITEPFNTGLFYSGFAVKHKTFTEPVTINNIDVDVKFYTVSNIDKFNVLIEYVENGSTKTIELGSVKTNIISVNNYKKYISLNAENVTRVKIYCRFEHPTNNTYSFVIGDLKLKINNVLIDGFTSWYTSFSKANLQNVVSPIPSRTEFNDLKAEIVNSSLYGKTMKVFGDSIFDTSANLKATPSIVAEMTGMTQYNYAVASSGYINNAIYSSPTWGSENTNVTKMIERSIDDGITPDYILVGAGTNDWDFQRKPLGTIDNAITENPTLDTFYGAVGLTIRKLHEYYPFAKYLFVTPIPRNQPTGSGNQHTAKGNGLKLTDYAKAIREVCEYFSIPYLDGISKCNFHLENELAKQKYMPDGLHPSEEGARQIYAPLIISALEGI